MIGFLLVMAAAMLFTLLGYSLIAGTFFMFMNVTIITALVGMIGLAIYGLLWEFYFQQPAKHIIANRRAAAWELAADDLGYVQLVPSKRYMPNGLVLWKFGWNLLPRPIKKLDIIQKLVGAKPRGRPPKDPLKAEAKQKEHEAREQQVQEIERKEQELAEQIGLKKCTWKGIGKPLWLSYLGLAANFNPYVLVPGEMNQDNPHSYFSQMRTYVSALADLQDVTKKDLLTKIDSLEEHVDKVRVVIDPRRFKEILPNMITNSQLEDHGRIHEAIGRESVTGMPLGKILLALLIGGVVITAIAAIYFLFLKPEQPQQAASLIRIFLHW